jgi:hypothetical protein
MSSKSHKILTVDSQQLGESLPKRSLPKDQEFTLDFTSFWKGARKTKLDPNPKIFEL